MGDGGESTALGIALRVLERLMLPAALAYLGYTASSASEAITAKIGSAQLELAQKQFDLARTQEKTSLDLKYLELFYRDVYSPEKDKQQTALSLLSLMNPELGTALANWVAERKGQSPAIVEQARSINQGLLLKALASYRVGIYFEKSRGDLGQLAKRIETALRARGVRGVAEPQGKDSAFFVAQYGASHEYEVRYEPGLEDEAADALLALLREVAPETRFVKRPVLKTKSPSFVSLFLTGLPPEP